MKRLDEKFCRHALPTSDDDLEIAAYHREKEETMEKYKDWIEHMAALRGDVALSLHRARMTGSPEDRLEVMALEAFLRSIDVAHDALIDLVGFAEEKKKETV